MYVCPSSTESFLIPYSQKRLSPKPRPFFWHETSVIVCLLDSLPFPSLTFYIARQDTDSTTAILVGVRESILRSQLSQINVI